MAYLNLHSQAVCLFATKLEVSIFTNRVSRALQLFVVNCIAFRVCRELYGQELRKSRYSEIIAVNLCF